MATTTSLPHERRCRSEAGKNSSCRSKAGTQHIAQEFVTPVTPTSARTRASLPHCLTASLPQKNTTINCARNTLAIIDTGNSTAYPTATRWSGTFDIA